MQTLECPQSLPLALPCIHNATQTIADSFGNFQAWGDFGDADGIIGLAFSDLLSDRKRNSTFLDAIAKAGNFSTVEFAVYLSTHDPNRWEWPLSTSSSVFPSEITFGGPKAHLHKGPFKYHGLLDERNYWAVKMLDFLVDGESMSNCRKSSLGYCRLVVDTGTSYLTAPAADGRVVQAVVQSGLVKAATIGASVPLRQRGGTLGEGGCRRYSARESFAVQCRFNLLNL